MFEEKPGFVPDKTGFLICIRANGLDDPNHAWQKRK